MNGPKKISRNANPPLMAKSPNPIGYTLALTFRRLSSSRLGQYELTNNLCSTPRSGLVHSRIRGESCVGDSNLEQKISRWKISKFRIPF